MTPDDDDARITRERSLITNRLSQLHAQILQHDVDLHALRAAEVALAARLTKLNFLHGLKETDRTLWDESPAAALATIAE